MAGHEPLWKQSHFLGRIGLPKPEGKSKGSAAQKKQNALAFALSDMVSKLEAAGPKLGEKLRLPVAESLKVLESTMAFDGEMQGHEAEQKSSSSSEKKDAAAADERLAAVIASLLRRLRELPVAGQLLILNGAGAVAQWTTSVLFVVERTGTEFTFTTINTDCTSQDGSDTGISYHPYWYDNEMQLRRQTAMSFAGIKEEKLLDPGVWYILLQHLVSSSRNFDPCDVYEVVLPHLVGATLNEARSPFRLSNEEAFSLIPKGLQPPQRIWNLLLCGLCFLLERRRINPYEFRSVCLQLDLADGSRLCEDIAKETQLSEGAQDILALFNAQLRRQFENDSQLPKLQIKSASQLIQQIETLMEEKLKSGLATPMPKPVLSLERSDTTVSPTFLCGLCHRHSTDRFAGLVVEMDFGYFVDLRLKLPLECKDPESEVVELIHSCASQCVALFGANAAMGFDVMLQRLAAMVEHVFMERLPCLPKPLSQQVMLCDAPLRDSSGMEVNMLPKGTRVTVVQRRGKDVWVEDSRDALVAGFVPSMSVGYDPTECLYRRLWESQHPTKQKRFVNDLHTIATHYAMCCVHLSGTASWVDSDIGAPALQAVTFASLLSCLDAGLRVSVPTSKGTPSFMTEVLRGDVLVDRLTDCYMPCAFSSNSLKGASLGFILSNCGTCNSAVLSRRRDVLLYFASVEKICIPGQQSASRQAGGSAPTQRSPWLLYDWMPMRKKDDKEFRAWYEPSTCQGAQGEKAYVEEKDDLTLRLLEACRNRFLGEKGQAEKPKYMKTDKYGSGKRGALVGVGWGPAMGGKKEDRTLQPFIYHRWKQAPEVHLAADIVWLYRLMLENSTVQCDGSNCLRDKNEELLSGAKTPLLMEPKWFRNDFAREGEETLALVIGMYNFTPTDEDPTEKCIQLGSLDDPECLSSSMKSIFDELAGGVITDDTPEADSTENKETKSGDEKANVTLTRLMSRPKPLSESDVLFSADLHNFDATLSLEEAELFHTIVTAPSLTVPLVLNFFASQRVGLLLNLSLRRTLARLLFEPGDFNEKPEVPSVCPFQLPATKLKRTQPEEDKYLFGGYTSLHAERANMTATQHGRFASELVGPAAQSTLMMWVDCCLGSSTLSTEKYDDPGVELMLFFCASGCEVLRLCYWLNVGTKLEKEVGALEDWLSNVCTAQIFTFITQTENADNADACSNLHKHLMLVNDVLIEKRIGNGEVNDGVAPLFIDLVLSAAFIAKKDPMYEVEVVLLRRRRQLLAWMDGHEDVRNCLLDQVVNLSSGCPFSSCRKPPLRAQKWQPAKLELLNCERVVESAHPVLAGINSMDMIYFPDAPYISILFDPMTELDDSSFLQFYRDAACCDPVGESYSDSAITGNWPGMMGRKPLVIPADRVFYKVTTSSESTAFGFKFRAIAPVSIEAKKDLEKYAAENGLAEGLDPLAYEIALQVTENDLKQAKRHLLSSRAQMMERAREMRATVTSGRGLFSDESGVVQVNLQTCAVCLNTQPPRPLPSEFHQYVVDIFTGLDETGKALKTGDYPSHTVVESSANRKWIQATHSMTKGGQPITYMMRLWYPIKPLRPEDEEVALTAFATRKNDDDSEWGPREVTSQTLAYLTEQGWPNYPALLKSGDLTYLDREYVRVPPDEVGTHDSPLLRRTVSILNSFRSHDGGPISKMKILLWLRKDDKACFYYMQPIDNSPGQFAEVVHNTVWDVLHFFALVDAGRRAHRKQIYSTDRRYSYAHWSTGLDQVSSTEGTLYAMGHPFTPLISTSMQHSNTVVVERSRSSLHESLEDNVEGLHGRFPFTGFDGEEERPESKHVEIFAQNDLVGAIPSALFEGYQFWRRGPDTFVAYPKPFCLEEGQSPPWWSGSAIVIVSDKELEKQEGDVAARVLRVPWDEGKGRSGGGLDILNQQLVLLDTLGCERGTALHRLVSVLSRLDSLAWILVWSSSVETEGTTKDIDYVELPRLGLSFRMVKLDGRPRLECLQLSGMYIKEGLGEDSPEDLALQSMGLVRDWWPYILLESSTGRTQVLMANYKWTRINFIGNALCKVCVPLVDAMFSQNYKERFPTKFFMYSIHSSSTHLVGSPNELLFLVYLHICAREFSDACRLVKYCFTDDAGDLQRASIIEWITEFKQSQVLSELPDLAAFFVRLDLVRVLNAEMFSDVCDNYTRYTMFMQNASADCVLSVAEQHSALLLIRELTNCDPNLVMSQALVDRERFLTALEQGTASCDIEVEPGLFVNGGVRWNELMTDADEVILDAQKRFALSAPTAVPSAPVVEVVAPEKNDDEEEGEPSPDKEEKVKLSWMMERQAIPLVSWRVSARVSGEGLRIYEIARQKRQERMKAMGFGFHANSDDEDDLDVERGAEMEIAYTTNDPKPSFEFTLPLPAVTYEFYVESLSCAGKGARSPYSQKYKSKKPLQEDVQHPPVRMPRDTRNVDVLAASCMPFPAFKSPKVVAEHASGQVLNLRGGEVVAYLSCMAKRTQSLEFFVAMWRFLTGEVAFDIYGQRRPLEERQPEGRSKGMKKKRLGPDECRCTNCGNVGNNRVAFCVSCGVMNARQVLATEDRGRWNTAVRLRPVSPASRTLCLLLLRKGLLATDACEIGFRDEAMVNVLRVILLSNSEKIPLLPAATGGYIAVDAGEGRQFVRQVLDMATPLLARIRGLTDSGKAADEDKEEETVTIEPALKSQKLHLVTDGMRERVSVRLPDVPAELRCSKVELAAFADAPLLPLAPPLVGELAISASKSDGDITQFEPMLLCSIIPEAKAYLERLQRDFDQSGHASKGSRGSENSSASSRPKAKLVKKHWKRSKTDVVKNSQNEVQSEFQSDLELGSDTNRTAQAVAPSEKQAQVKKKLVRKKTTPVDSKSRRASNGPAGTARRISKTGTKGLNDLLMDGMDDLGMSDDDLSDMPTQEVSFQSKLPPLPPGKSSHGQDPVLIPAAVKTLLASSQEGVQEAAESLRKMQELTQGIADVLKRGRASMDEAWNLLHQRFGVPSSTLHPRLLLITLFSTKCRDDLTNLSGLSKEQAIALEASLSLLMLRSVSIAHLDLCLDLALQLRGKFSAWLVRALPHALSSPETAGYIRSCMAAVPGGKDILKKAEDEEQPENKTSVLAAFIELEQDASSVIGLLKAQRYHGIWAEGNQELSVDLRCLLIEFFKGLLLRKRQVEISKELAGKAQSGQSSVQQMIMGAGKSTVIGPLLGLMLADGNHLVMVICPEALLPMARDCLTGILGCVLGRHVYNFSWQRKACPEIKEVLAVYKKLERAVSGSGVFISTPTSIKTFMLQYLSVLQEAEYADGCLTVSMNAFKKAKFSDAASKSAEWFRSRDEIADKLAKVLKLWKRQGISVIDEVDLVLHPLKSELNFPIGAPEDLQPQPQRWELPMFLFEPVLAAVAGVVPEDCPPEGHEGYTAMERIRTVIREGIASFSVQQFPHLVIMSKEWYDEYLRLPLGQWALVYLEKQLKPELKDPMEKKEELLAYIGAAKWTKGENLSKIVGDWALPKEKVQVLNLCRQWILALIVHCLGKRNRIDYGLLIDKKEDYKKVGKHPPARQVMAVPFVGKDRPSAAAEFASPDVTIGLTVLAYYYEGLRQFNYYILASVLKSEMQKETGPFKDRAHRVLFQSWIDEAQLVKKDIHVLPLELLQAGDLNQLLKLEKLLADSGHVREHYLYHFIFASVYYVKGVDQGVQWSKLRGTRARLARLSSSSMDLGGEILFNVRLGFTGTPSEVLPQAFTDPKTKERCVYEPGSDAQIVQTLTSPSMVRVEVIERGHPAAVTDNPCEVWSVSSILGYIAANATKRNWYALIDTGALITGFSNLEVARELMALGLKENGIKGVVYLDDEDAKKVLMADGRENIPFASCGLKPGERFTFFDQVHCTGMDVPQVPNAVGVATLGKGMTLRDHAQACWRMRGLGKGQTIVLLIIPEVMKQIREISESLPDEEDLQQKLLRDTMAFLIAGQCKSQDLQREALTLQELGNFWRQVAMDELLKSECPSRYDGARATKVLALVDKKGNEANITAFKNSADVETTPENPPAGKTWLPAVVIAAAPKEDILKIRLQNGTEVKVKPDKKEVVLSENEQLLDVRFFPPDTSSKQVATEKELAARMRALKSHLKKVVSLDLNAEDAENDDEDGKTPGANGDDVKKALEKLEGKIPEIQAGIKFACDEKPKFTIEKCAEECRELLTKGEIEENTDRMSNMWFYCVCEKDYDYEKVILQQRKRCVDKYCLDFVVGAGDGFVFGTKEEGDGEEQTEEKEDDEDKVEEEDEDGEEAAPIEVEIDSTRPMELFRKHCAEVFPGWDPVLRLRACVDVFREEMTQLQVPAETSLVPDTLPKRMGSLIEAHKALCMDCVPRMQSLLAEAQGASKAKSGEEGEGLDSEMCQEQEQEQEQELTKESDDLIDTREFIEAMPMKPWPLENLLTMLKDVSASKGPFYPVKEFVPQDTKEYPPIKLRVPENMLISSNVSPSQVPKDKQGVNRLRRLPNVCVLLYVAREPVGAWIQLTLCEAETVRLWLLRNDSIKDLAVGLVTLQGFWLTQPVKVLPPHVQHDPMFDTLPLGSSGPLAFMKLFNAGFTFKNEELVCLLEMVKESSCDDRKKWLEAVTQARKRDRAVILGTPADKLFEHRDASQLKLLHQSVSSVREAIKAIVISSDCVNAFSTLDVNADGRLQLAEARTGFQKLAPNLTEEGMNLLIKYIDQDNSGMVDFKEFMNIFDLEEESLMNKVKELVEHQQEESTGTASAVNTTSSQSVGTSSFQRKEVEIVSRRAVRGVRAILSSKGLVGSLNVVSGHAVCFHSPHLVSCRAGGHASVAPTGLRLSGSFAYCFEVTLVEVLPSGSCTIGIATMDFASDEGVVGVGDDRYSWGVCGFGRVPTTRHNGKRQPIPGVRWTVGSVIGVIVDIPSGVLRMMVDGTEQQTQLGDLQLKKHPFVIPVISVENGIKVEVNWGAQCIRFPPPKLFHFPPITSTPVVTIEYFGRMQVDAGLRASPTQGANPSGRVGELVRAVDESNKFRFGGEADEYIIQKFPGHVYEITAPEYSYRGAVFLLCGMLHATGSWHYEVEFLEVNRWFNCAVGWGDANCKGLPDPEEGYYGCFSVGDQNSWGLDTCQFGLRANNQSQVFPHLQVTEPNLSPGDRIGCHVDVDNGSASYSLNGKFDIPLGLAFQKMAFVGGLRPMISLRYGVKKVRISLSASPPAGQLPKGAAPVADYVDKFLKHSAANPQDPTPGYVFYSTRSTSVPTGAYPLLVSAGHEYVDVEPCTLHKMASRTRADSEASAIADGENGEGHEVDPAALHSHGWQLRAFAYSPVVRGSRGLGEGHYYYEVRLVSLFERSEMDLWRAKYCWGDSSDEEDGEKEVKGGIASIGWSLPFFNGDCIAIGVGGDRLSWGFEGINPRVPSRFKHDADTVNTSPLKRWEEGQIIGVACSIQMEQATFDWTVDGKRVDPGIDFTADLSIYAESTLVPAISLHRGMAIEINFGPDFWFAAKVGSSVQPWEDSHLYTPLSAERGVIAESEEASVIRKKRTTRAGDADGNMYEGKASSLNGAALRPTMEEIEKWKKAKDSKKDAEAAREAINKDVALWFSTHTKDLRENSPVAVDLSSLLVSSSAEGSNNIPYEHFEKFIEKLASLHVTSLDMSQNSFISTVNGLGILTALTTLLQVPKLPLQILNMDHCRLYYDESGALQLTRLLKAMEDCESLQRVDFNGNVLGKGLTKFCRNACRPKKDKIISMESFSIGDNQLTMEVAKDLLPELAQSALHSVNLGHNPFGDEGAMLLATELRYNRDLVELTLPALNLTPRGVCAIASCFYRKHKLRTLSLAFNSIGEDGASAVAQMLSTYPKLHTLDLTSGEIPSAGLVEIADVLRQDNDKLRVLKIGDNVGLDDAAGEAIGRMLAINTSLRSIDLGSFSNFNNFEACNLLGKNTSLEEVVFRGRSLETREKCKFVFEGCKKCVNLSSMDVGLLVIHDAHQQVAAFFEKPLTYLLKLDRSLIEDSMLAPAHEPSEKQELGNTKRPSRVSVARAFNMRTHASNADQPSPLNKSSKSRMSRMSRTSLTTADNHDQEHALRAAITQYLVQVKYRNELIHFLIEQRNARIALESERPFVELEDAQSAVHAVIELTKDRDSPGGDSPELVEWQWQVLTWMFGKDSTNGFPEMMLVQLPICSGELVGAPQDSNKRAANVLMRDVSVRIPIDAWDLVYKEDGKTALMKAICLSQTDVALLIIRRYGARACEFRQEGEDISWLYGAITSVDGEERHERKKDHVGIDMTDDETGVPPVRAAAALGLWEVVQALRNAGCRDRDESMAAQSKVNKYTVWHQLATPELLKNHGRLLETMRIGQEQEQLAWAEALASSPFYTPSVLLVKDKLGRIPLHWCALGNYPGLTKVLGELTLENKAVNDEGFQINADDTKMYYCDRGNRGSGQCGPEVGQCESCQRFQEEAIPHSPCNGRDEEKFTPLGLAALHGHFRCVDVLLELEDGAECLTTGHALQERKEDRKKRRATSQSALPCLCSGDGGFCQSMYEITISLIHSLFHFEPSRKSLLWPIAPYDIVLLQHFLLPFQVQTQASDSKSGAHRNYNRNQAVHDKILEKMSETAEGDRYRKRFIYKYIFRSLMDHLLLFFLLIAQAIQLFIGMGASNFDNVTFDTHAYMGEVMVDDEFPFSVSEFAKMFGDIGGTEDYWDFSSNIVVPTLFANADGFMDNYYRLIGSVRMQRRVYDKYTCEMPAAFASVEASCYRGSRSFLSWQDDTLLDFTSAEQTVADLQAADWLEEAAMVRTQFALFNAEHRNVLIGELLAEFRTSGRAKPKHRNKVVPWFPLNDLGYSLVNQFLPFLALCVYTILFNLRQLHLFIVSGKSGFSNVQDLVNIPQGILLFCVCGLILLTMALQANLDVKVDANEFIDFSTVKTVFLVLQWVFGFTFILQTLRFMTVLRLLPGIGPSVQAIAMTLGDSTVWRFLLYLSVMLIGFSISMFILFGVQAESYVNPIESFFTLYRFSYGDWDLGEMTEIDSVLGYIMFFILSFVLTGTLTNVFIAIVGERYGSNLEASEPAYVNEVNQAMAKWFGEVFLAYHCYPGSTQRRVINVTQKELQIVKKKFKLSEESISEATVLDLEENDSESDKNIDALRTEVTSLRSQLSSQAGKLDEVLDILRQSERNKAEVP